MASGNKSSSRLAILAITRGGRRLAARLATRLAGAQVLTGKKVARILRENWQQYDAFICVMAAGIVVRSIAPLLRDKKKDPCVLVLDEQGRHVISLLSGHLGGGNELACRVAAITDGSPVITTASDTLGLAALDLWAAANNLAARPHDLTQASAQLVNQGSLRVFSTLAAHSWPAGLVVVDEPQQADLCISPYCYEEKFNFHPRSLVVGVGCNRGTPLAEFQQALAEFLAAENISERAIWKLASIDKKNDEAALLAFAEQGGWPIDFFSKEQINQFTNLAVSRAALRAVGAIGVAEPCALLGARTDNLLKGKRKWQNITMAIAQAPSTLSAQGRAAVNI